MIDVMFYEAFEEEEAAIKKFLPKDVRAEFTWKTIQESGDEPPPAKLICIRTQSSVPDVWARDINGVLTRSQGFEHLLTISKSIPCGYLDNYCGRAVAEQAVAMMIALMRKFKKQLFNFETFTRNGLTGLECRGRNVFVVGVGHIGSEIVDIARGLRMEAKGFDIEKKIKDLAYVSLKEGIPWADAIFCALPLTKETDGLLNYNTLKKAKKGAVFINISRGEISPAQDLKELLEEEILGGASLDVYPHESLLAHSLRAGDKNVDPQTQTLLELSKRENVLFTPHNAFNTQEALEQKASLSAEATAAFLKEGSFPSPVPSA